MRLTAMAAFILAAASPAAAAEPAKPVEVMVLGTYHFGNPGQDLHNAKVDDVTAPKRQAEVQAVVDAVAAFRPTKVMVERDISDPGLVDPRYAAFKPDSLTSDRNEIAQIGYRLARQLGHDRVYGIDEQPKDGEPDYFPFGKVADYAKAHGLDAQFAALMAEGEAATKNFEEKQARMSIAALLVDYNDPSGFQSSQAGYYDILKIGGTEQQPGADLNAGWYLRNAKIFGKLMSVAQPGDRIIVVYGAGHNYWLRHFASETRGYRNVDPVPYLRKAANR